VGHGGQALIAYYVLSCRVMGRRVEETMVAAAAHRAAAMGAKLLVAPYRQTEKNKPCFDFWRRSGLTFDERDACFKWSTDETYFVPRGIAVVGLPIEVESTHTVAHGAQLDDELDMHAVSS
jgi:hypothetical protein